MKIAISGGTGMVGEQLCALLTEKGHEVAVLTRNPKPDFQYRQIEWDPDRQLIDDLKMEGTECIINLAGAPVAQRWTDENKKAIMESRVNSTRMLVGYIARNKGECRTLINASAVGYYPASDDFLKESDAPGTNFLSEVVKAWENEAFRAEGLGCRVVALRIGIVLDESGGAVGRLLPLFKLGLGSPVGSGTQWQSWIHVEDLARMFLYATEHEKMQGSYNAVSPRPVQNKTFSKALAEALDRPMWLPAVPAFALKLVFGKMSQVILDSQKVSSEKIERAGFTFSFTTIEQAFKELFGK
jgi:uncharacterized protein (TIGR01777 family)